MKKTPKGTPVGVDDPYLYVSKCDHLTGEGFCRLILENRNVEDSFRIELERNGHVCPVVEQKWKWENCPYFRYRANEKVCARCGLGERLNTHDNSRPLLERHHLSYIENRTKREGKMGHEITVMLCRWCHAKVHKSGARINDEVEPDRNALELMEKRKSAEMNETKFESARERYNRKLM